MTTKEDVIRGFAKGVIVLMMLLLNWLVIATTLNAYSNLLLATAGGAIVGYLVVLVLLVLVEICLAIFTGFMFMVLVY